jgi:hypothetical protein
MKSISGFIKELQEMQETHGDLEIIVSDNTPPVVELLDQDEDEDTVFMIS